MGEHKTQHSRDVIAAIADVGTALGYHVCTEWPMPGTGAQPERLDLAFLVDESSERPVFAVEVDSADVPASMSNAIKIFGKATRDWIKPSFVFHVFLSASREGNRLDNAETAFNTQNYRTYVFDHDKQSFVVDLLQHHRAIRSEIDFEELGVALDAEIWDPVDRYAIFTNVGRKPRVDELAYLTLNTHQLDRSLSRAVLEEDDQSLTCGELSFTGRMFLTPLLDGLHAFVAPSEAARIFEQFTTWQNSPHEIIFHTTLSCVGLSQEFDVAIAELAPPIFCLTAMLFSADHNAAKTLCEQLLARATGGYLNSTWKRYALVWCAIASTRVGAGATAEKALEELNILGGCPISLVTNPPTLMFVEEDEEEDEGWRNAIAKAPPSPLSLETLTTALAEIEMHEETADRIVAQILTDDDLAFRLNDFVLRAKFADSDV